MLMLSQLCLMAAQIKEISSANSPPSDPPRTLRTIKVYGESSNCFPEGMELQMGQMEKEPEKMERK